MVALTSRSKMTNEQMQLLNSIVWLTEEQAAEYINVSKHTLRNWRMNDIEDRPKSYKTGSGVKAVIQYKKHELNEWLSKPRHGF